MKNTSTSFAVPSVNNARPILVVELWRYKWPALAALGTMLVVFFWPSIPLKGVENWLQFFYYYTPQNLLYAALTLLAGLYVGVYVYHKTACAACGIGEEKTGAVGLLGGVLLGACPACIPVLAVFLPLGVSVYLSRISWVFLALSVALLAFLTWRMKGFKKP